MDITKGSNERRIPEHQWQKYDRKGCHQPDPGWKGQRHDADSSKDLLVVIATPKSSSMKSAGEVDSSWNRLRRNRFHMLLLQKLSAKVNGESSTAFYSKSAFRMNIGQVISGWFDSFRVWSTLICLLLRSLLRRLPPIRPRRSDPFLRFLLLPCRPSAPMISPWDWEMSVCWTTLSILVEGRRINGHTLPWHLHKQVDRSRKFQATQERFHHSHIIKNYIKSTSCLFFKVSE